MHLVHSVFGSNSNRVKGKVYETCILPIPLYGSESWCLSDKILQKLRNFHNRCVRAMCQMNRFRTWKEHISTDDLLTKVSLKCVDSYVFKQQLRWIGHVVRMPWERLPRKMLTCWVRSKRPREVALRFANISIVGWDDVAHDRLK